MSVVLTMRQTYARENTRNQALELVIHGAWIPQFLNLTYTRIAIMCILRLLLWYPQMYYNKLYAARARYQSVEKDFVTLF